MCYSGFMATMGRLLKTARVGAGYDRPEDFAHLVGKSSRQVREYEKGTVIPPSDVLQKWAAATGKATDDFTPTPEEAPVPEPPPTTSPAIQPHPGIEELARPENAAIREATGIPDDLVAAARRWLLYGPDGEPWPIGTIQEAIDLLKALGGRLQRRAGRGQ